MDELERLKFEVRKLISIIDYEIGRRWMSFELRLQIEEVAKLSEPYDDAPAS